MRIGEICALTGLAPATLRYYEREGLVPRVERRGGKRFYSPADVARVRLIKAARDAGFSIADLRAATAAGWVGRGAALAKRFAATEAALARLLQQRQFLRAAAACGCSSAPECALI